MNAKSFSLTVAVLATLLITPPHAFGQAWKLTSAPNGAWVAVASSADGSHLAAAEYPGRIYVSVDSGTNWVPTTAPYTNWVCLASSADGTRLFAAVSVSSIAWLPGPIYSSTDSGTTWAATTAPIADWSWIAASADGTRLAAVTGSGSMYISTDSGVTWTSAAVPSRPYCSSIASSADGGTLLVGADPPYRSTDFGATWQPMSGNSFYYVACSADGRFVVTAAYWPTISISTNAGANWTSINPYGSLVEYLTSVACSADGRRLVVASWGGPLTTSADAGATWTPATGPSGAWLAVASSADGCKLVAAMQGGPIYTWHAIPSLAIECSGTNITLCWPFSASGYALQQNPNAATINWSTLTNLPTINNLRAEVTVQSPVGPMFYRLRLQ